MELKGLAKQGRVVAVAMASCGMALGMTAPVAAAQDAETWEMPALREEVLQNAVDSILATAGEENVKFSIINQTANQVVYNYTNWLVCGQSPKADEAVEIDSKPKTIYLAVNRRTDGC